MFRILILLFLSAIRPNFFTFSSAYAVDFERIEKFEQMAREDFSKRVNKNILSICQGEGASLRPGSFFHGGITTGLIIGGILNESGKVHENWMIPALIMGGVGGLAVTAVMNGGPGDFVRRVRLINAFAQELEDEQRRVSRPTDNYMDWLASSLEVIGQMPVEGKLPTSYERWGFLSLARRTLFMISGGVFKFSPSDKEHFRSALTEFAFSVDQIEREALLQNDFFVSRRARKIKREILGYLVHSSEHRFAPSKQLAERFQMTMSDLEKCADQYLEILKQDIRQYDVVFEYSNIPGDQMTVQYLKDASRKIKVSTSESLTGAEVRNPAEYFSRKQNQLPLGLWIRLPDVSQDIFHFYPLTAAIPAGLRKTPFEMWTHFIPEVGVMRKITYVSDKTLKFGDLFSKSTHFLNQISRSWTLPLSERLGFPWVSRCKDSLISLNGRTQKLLTQIKSYRFKK